MLDKNKCEQKECTEYQVYKDDIVHGSIFDMIGL